jgi:Ca-activated chloride channel family protein
MTKRIKPTNFDMDRHPESGVGVLTTARGILPLRSLDVRAAIHGLGSKTTVCQTFVNQFDEPIEATYIFPLPGRDAVTRFVMHVNGRTIDGELQERGKARETYDKAIEAGYTAAIAEEERSETFTMRVGNIAPGEEVEIEMDLIGQLPIAGDEATFRFPLVVAERYISGNALDGKSVGDGTATDTDSVPDASRVTPPVLIPGLPNPVELSIEVDIHMPASFDHNILVNHLTSSLHSVIVNDQGVEDGLPLTVRVQPGERLNRDFILRFPLLADENSCTLLAAPDGSGDSVFSVNIVPPDISDAKKYPRDVVFILDRSGSMGGWQMVAARRAVARMIDSMRDEDRFTVLAFDNSIEYPWAANNSFAFGADRNRWNVVQWLSTIDARGGTDLEDAIAAGIRLHKTEGRDGCQPLVVLITDGQVGAEDAVLRTIEDYGGKQTPTFFCLGIDKAVNHGLLTRIAKMTGGTCETVESEVQLDKVMDRFHCEIGAPVLANVTIKPVGKTKIRLVTPTKKINVFPQRPISIFGIAKKDAIDLEFVVSATMPDGSLWETTVSSQPSDTETLSALWGRELLRDLEDQYVVNANKKLQKKIIAVSLKSQVLSRFTSYVAVDRSRIVNEEGASQKVVQPVEQVEDSGLQQKRKLFHSIFGRAAGGASQRGRTMRMVKSKQRGIQPNVPAKQASAMDDDSVLEELSLLPDGFNRNDGESADSMLQEFTDTSIDFTDIMEDSGESAEDRMAKMLDMDARRFNASAILLHRLDGNAKYELLVDGEVQHTDRIHNLSFPKVCQSIEALAGVNQGVRRLPRISYWVGPSGIRWRVFELSDNNGYPVKLLADMDRNASLSFSTINDPVEVKEMLRHYLWLRPILDTICALGNRASRFSKPKQSQKRLAQLKRAQQWLTLLEELASHMTDSQASVILRMVTSFGSALESSVGENGLDTIDVLNGMIEDSNEEILEEERKAFWT